jgi:hypothetical protein
MKRMSGAPSRHVIVSSRWVDSSATGSGTRTAGSFASMRRESTRLRASRP